MSAGAFETFVLQAYKYSGIVLYYSTCFVFPTSPVVFFKALFLAAKDVKESLLEVDDGYLQRRIKAEHSEQNFRIQVGEWQFEYQLSEE